MVKLQLRRAAPYATPQALVRLFSQLAVAARSGLPIAEALQILVEDDEGESASRALVRDLAARTRAGGSLSDGLRQAGPAFAPQTVALVRKAEEAGALAQALELLARDYEHRARFRVATRGAVTWPAVSFAFFVFTLLAMAIWVVPTFEGLFAAFEARLPGPTRLLIAASRLIVDGWVVWLPLVAAAFFAVRYQGRWEWLQSSLDTLALRAPLVRSYVSKTLASRLSSMLLAAAEGAPLREALAHLLATTGSRRLAAPVARLAERVASGLSLPDAVAATPELPGRVRVAVALGQRTEKLAAALRQAIELSDEEAERSLVRLEQAAVVTAYILVGTLVGIMVLAMYLPIFKMGSVI